MRVSGREVRNAVVRLLVHEKLTLRLIELAKLATKRKAAGNAKSGTACNVSLILCMIARSG
jgi:hypothetical protein